MNDSLKVGGKKGDIHVMLMPLTDTILRIVNPANLI